MTDFIPPDQAARDAASDPSRNVVLRASAGTGKTTVLVTRYLRLLECGVPPRHILALTFTRKAAQEMKDRILSELAKPARRGVLAERADVAEVNLQTIDAFNLGLVREFPLDAGVSPGVEILDERAMPAVREAAIRRVFSGATGFDQGALRDLPLLLNRPPSAIEKAVNAYLERRLIWRPQFEEQAGRRLRPAPPPPGELAGRTGRENGTGELAGRTGRENGPGERAGRTGRENGPGERAGLQSGAAEPPRGPRLSDALDEVAAARADLAAAPGLSLPERLALSSEPRPDATDVLDRDTLHGDKATRLFTDSRKGPRKGIPVGFRQPYKAVRDRLLKNQAEWRDYLERNAFQPFWTLCQATEAEYQRLKRERGVMDFDDLTEAATRLLSQLGEFSESRFRLEARYHHLLLDEFHDTSDPQWALLRHIIQPWFEGEGLAAEEVKRVTKGRLSRPTIFIVGDHKQSIYRFRNARVEILGRAEADVEELEKAASGRRATRVLRWNFRSTRALRRFVNRASRAIAAKQKTEQDWAFRYDESDEFPEGKGGPKQEAPPPGAPLAIAVSDTPRLPPLIVAERIRRLVEEDGVSPGRIAMLARGANRLPDFRDALEALNVPCYLMRGTHFFSTSEMRDLEALIRCLARPFSDRRAVELLRSRFFAVPAEGLVRLRRAASSDTPFADFLRGDGDTLPEDLDPVSRKRLERAGAQVPDWIALSRRLPPAQTVDRILEQTDYAARAKASARGRMEGEQTRANLGRARELLAALSRGGFTNFEELAERVAAASRGDITEAPVEAADAVQALTIHASKGLEFDHVFLVDMNSPGGGGRGMLRVRESDDGNWSIGLVRKSSRWAVEDGGRAESEERRCLYVAMTRARRSLALSWHTPFTKKGDPYKPRGLTKFLPGALYREASRTARESETREIDWDGQTIEVLAGPPGQAPQTGSPSP